MSASPASAFRFSARWLARVNFALPTTRPTVTTGDCALAMFAIAMANDFDGDIRYGRTGRTLVEHMRARRDGIVEEHPYPFAARVHMIDLQHHLPRLRPALFAQSVERVARMTNRGRPVFDRFEFKDGYLEFDLAGATFDAHPAMGRPREGGDFLTATLAPSVLFRMSSVSSIHMACRLSAWWQGNTRTGIKGTAARLTLEKGRLSAWVPVDKVAETLGIVGARSTPSFLQPTLDRMRDDLLVHLDVSLKTSWEPGGERARYLDVTATQRKLILPTHEEDAVLNDDGASPTLPSEPAQAPSGRIRLPTVRSTRSQHSPAPIVAPSPVTRSEDVDDSDTDDIVNAPSEPVVAQPEPPRTHLPRPAYIEPIALREFDVERPVEDLTDAELDALTEEQLDQIRAYEAAKKALEPDPWESVPGFEGYRADTMQPVFDDDWSKRGVERHWYPDIVYPITDPRDASMMLTVSKPNTIGGPCGTHRAPETHPPCPDHRQVPHRHPFGIWSSEEYEGFRTELRGGSCMAWVAAPGDTTVRWCERPDQYQSALNVGIRWAEDRRREANLRSPYSGMERMRRDWREEQGYEPGDKSHDDRLPGYLAYE